MDTSAHFSVVLAKAQDNAAFRIFATKRKRDGVDFAPEIDPGVPWTASVGKKPMLLALKSGNFGGRDFFAKALRQLAGGQP